MDAFDRSQGIREARAHAQSEVASAVMAKVYWWMALGLGITATVAFTVSNVEPLTRLIFGNPIVLILLFVAEIGLVIALSAMIHKLSPAAAAGMFLTYSALNGLTLSAIFLVYTQASLTTTFLVTGGTFAGMATYGTLTKRDLTGWGSFLFMGLIGLVIAMVVNLFLQSPMLYWGITMFGVLIFVGLTAYDVQRIRRMATEGFPIEKLGVYGALRLYLDFINLFLMLLRLLGSRR